MSCHFIEQVSKIFLLSEPLDEFEKCKIYHMIINNEKSKTSLFIHFVI